MSTSEPGPTDADVPQQGEPDAGAGFKIVSFGAEGDPGLFGTAVPGSDDYGSVPNADRAVESVLMKVLDVGPSEPAPAVGKSGHDLAVLGGQAPVVEIGENRKRVQAGALHPHPFDRKLLKHAQTLNTRLQRAISVFVTNTVGLGWRVEPTFEVLDPEVTPERRREFKAEKRRIETLLDTLNPEKSFGEVAQHVKLDEETYGEGYMEVVRTLTGEVAELHRIDASTIFVRRDGLGFVQIRGGKKRYFAKFGAPTVIDPESGQVVGRKIVGRDGAVSVVPEDAPERPRRAAGGNGTVIPLNRRANELLQFRIANVQSEHYGVPRYVAATTAIVGSNLAAKRNVVFFENDAVPRMAVIVQGGELTEEAVNDIRRFLEREAKGTNNAHRVMVLQAEPHSIGAQNKQRTEIQIHPLTVGTTDDASFQQYRRANDVEIREAFGINEIFFSTQDVNRACYDEETEVLTRRRGWVRHRDVAADDEVLALDPEARRTEWLRPEERLCYRYDGPLVRLKGAGLDVAVTPEHKLFVGSGPAGGDLQWGLKEAGALAAADERTYFHVVGGAEQGSFERPCPDLVRIPKLTRGGVAATFGRDREVPLDLWLEFLAWFVRGGEMDPNDDAAFTISLDRSTPLLRGAAEKMEQCLSRLPILFEPCGDADDLKAWRARDAAVRARLASEVSADGRCRRLPSWVFDLPPENLTLMLQVLTDGGVDRDQWSDREYVRCATSSIQLCDDLQRLLVLTGYRTDVLDGLALFVRGDSKETRGAFRVGSDITMVPYSGFVHCLRLPKHHIYCTRRGGVVAFHGNSAFIGRAITNEQTLAPDRRRWEHRINTTLMREPPISMSGDAKLVFLPPDTTDDEIQARMLKLRSDAGGMTVNEVRAALGLPPLDVSIAENEYADEPMPVFLARLAASVKGESATAVRSAHTRKPNRTQAPDVRLQRSLLADAGVDLSEDLAEFMQSDAGQEMVERVVREKVSEIVDRIGGRDPLT